MSYGLEGGKRRKDGGWEWAGRRLGQLSSTGVVVKGMEKRGWIQEQFERKRVVKEAT